ncbi:MAG TPA: hypothetical protein VHW01_18350 [Polyangiaceae bacterium]|jgi:hypothetical protein|nr:hypothetical protein [Polyangiaceae bacterium]
MTPALHNFEPGRVYRTRELGTSNPARLAKSLVKHGKLQKLRNGLFAAPKPSKFGSVPPGDEALMHAYLGGDEFVFTGPEKWNALGLGTTAMFASTVVYNRKRTAEPVLSGRRFRLRRVSFPQEATPEWFVVDLFENAPSVGASLDDLVKRLAAALRDTRFAPDKLKAVAAEYGTKKTQAAIGQAVNLAAA